MAPSGERVTDVLGAVRDQRAVRGAGGRAAPTTAGVDLPWVLRGDGRIRCRRWQPGFQTIPPAEPRAGATAGFLSGLLEAFPCLPHDLTLVHVSAAQVVAGAMLASDTWKRLAATLFPATIAGLPFWSAQDPAGRASGAIAFAKNTGILGALLLAPGCATSSHCDRPPR